MQLVLFAVLGLAAAAAVGTESTVDARAALIEVRMAVTDLRPKDSHRARYSPVDRTYAYTQSAASGTGGAVVERHDHGAAWLVDSMAGSPGPEGSRARASTRAHELQAEIAAPWRLKQDLTARAASAAYFWVSPHTRLTLSARGNVQWRGVGPSEPAPPAAELRLQLHAGDTTVVDTLASGPQAAGSVRARVLSVSFDNVSEQPVKVQAFLYAQVNVDGAQPALLSVRTSAQR
jgi:hypothetical protein